MIRSPRASASRTQTSASPTSATESSIGRTRAGAPPCSGPESAPTAEETTAPQSAPVEATIRAVNVDEQPPDLLERDLPDELLDVDPAVTKRPALTVRLGDLRLEGHDALETGPDHLGVRVAHSAPSRSTSRPIPRSRAAESTRAAAAASCTATPTDLYRVSSSCDVRPGFTPLTS